MANIEFDAVLAIIWCTYTALLRDVTFCGRCQWKVFYSMGTTRGTEQGCIGSSSWREVVVLAGGGDEETLIIAKAENCCYSCVDDVEVSYCHMCLYCSVLYLDVS